MIAELGLVALILGFLFALMLATLPAYGIYANKPIWRASATLYLKAQVFFVFLSFICLGLAFLNDDFTVLYVFNNSSVSLPWFYKACAIWGGHEGSMLLWLTILNGWMLMVGLFGKNLDEAFRLRVLSVLALISIGFFLFILTVSNPFLRQFQLLETQGRDLNPLLQDPGFLFHPPLLYMGYVGFSVAFAFSIAALLTGQIRSEWARWARPWTLAAWSCLTAGITLGSLWAYRELGWGGWWFWDPVENASFMPWLVGTALLHSLVVSEKRGQCMVWTLLLAIVAFSLSLIGTFLVRSGILTSVHAFAVDPKRGLFILGFLGLVIGGAFLLFACRIKKITRQENNSLVSVESALMLNNVFLFVCMLTVLLGTLYPLLAEALNLGKISVGAPYFNAVFVPLFLPLLLLMGFGMHLRWRRDSLKGLLKKLSAVGLASFVLPLGLLYFLTDTIKIWPLSGLIAASWILLSTAKLIAQGLIKRKSAFWGMVLAHCGIAITVIGIAVSTGYGLEQDEVMKPGDSVKLASWTVQFLHEKPLKGPNYGGFEADFALINASGKVYHLYPQKRRYQNDNALMTEAAIKPGLFQDIYLALGESLGDNAWSVRIYDKPFVRWIWAGGFMILAGGLMAILDKSYLRKKIKSLKTEAVCP